MISSIVGRSSKSSTPSNPFPSDLYITPWGSLQLRRLPHGVYGVWLEAVAEGEGRHTPIALDVLSVTGDEL